MRTSKLKRRARRVRRLDYRVSHPQLVRDATYRRERRVIFQGTCLACGKRLYSYEDLPNPSFRQIQKTGPLSFEHLYLEFKAMNLIAFPPLAWNFIVRSCPPCAYTRRGDHAGAILEAVLQKAREDRNDYDKWLEASYLGTPLPVPDEDYIP